MNEDFDMEDLEARLYGEVYYNTDETTPTLPLSSTAPKPQDIIISNQTKNSSLNISEISLHTKKIINPLAMTRASKAKPRYFKEKTKNHPKQTAHIENPVIKLPNPLNKEVMSKAERIQANRIAKNYRKRQRQKERRKLEFLNKKLKETQDLITKVTPLEVNQVVDEVILLSDDEEENSAPIKEPEVKPEVKTADIKEKTDSKTDIPEEDEEIVFIEPPPIEVINLEIESESDNEEIDKSTNNNNKIDANPEKSASQPDLDRSTPDSTANDFLDSSVLNSSSNFNFSLHGKEFQDDFVKPTTPTNNEVYETESSCSTTDLPKDFTAKAVVFNECEFPQGDMFNENNLESFGHYITPKRARLNEQLPDLSPMTSTDGLNDKTSNLNENNARAKRKTKSTASTAENLNKDSTSDIYKSAQAEKTIENENNSSKNQENTEIAELPKSPVQDSFFHDVPDVEKLPVGLEIVDEVGGSGSDIETISDDLDADFRADDDEDAEIQLVNCSSGPSRRQESLEGNLNRFDVDFIQRTMTDDPSMWEISLNDSVHCQYVSERGPRCRLCRQIGHFLDECPKRHDPIRCKLCGKRGHSSDRCPNDCCHHCGNKGSFTTLYCYKCVKWRNSICGICRMRGHSNRACPDLWRRYCSTITEGPIKALQEPQIKPFKDLWCSGCAKNGHLEHNCNYNNRLNPPIDPRVHSFQEVYAVDKKKVNEMVTPTTPAAPPILASTSSGKKSNKSKNKINPVHFLKKKVEDPPVDNSRKSPVCLIDLSAINSDNSPINSQNNPDANFNKNNEDFSMETSDFNTTLYQNFVNNSLNAQNSVFNDNQNLHRSPLLNNQLNQFQSNIQNITTNQNFQAQTSGVNLNLNQIRDNSNIFNSTPKLRVFTSAPNLEIFNSNPNSGPLNSTPNRSNIENPSQVSLTDSDLTNLQHLHSCFRQPAIEGTHVSLGVSYQDICNIKCFLFKPVLEVQVTIRKELAELQKVAQLDISRMRDRYKQSVNNLHNLHAVNPRMKNILHRCFRQLNMMIFGVFRMRDGERHLQVLNQVLEILPQGQLTKYRRNQLVTSYNYIFGARKVNSVNYLYFLRVIAERIRKLNN